MRHSHTEDSKGKRWSRGDFATAALMTVIPVIVLLVALLPGHAYSYFIFLRVIVCACALMFVAMFHGALIHPWMYGFGFIVLLYNPIIRVHLTRDIWAVLNMLTIAAFVAGFVVLWLRSRRAAKSPQ